MKVVLYSLLKSTHNGMIHFKCNISKIKSDHEDPRFVIITTENKRYPTIECERVWHDSYLATFRRKVVPTFRDESCNSLRNVVKFMPHCAVSHSVSTNFECCNLNFVVNEKLLN
jgi:hypothetical protein